MTHDCKCWTRFVRQVGPIARSLIESGLGQQLPDLGGVVAGAPEDLFAVAKGPERGHGLDLVLVGGLAYLPDVELVNPGIGEGVLPEV